MQGAGALAGLPGVSEAAYGDKPKVFGEPTNTSGFIQYSTSDYSFLVPSKFNPSSERPFEGIDVRFEDNFDAVNAVTVLKSPTSKKSIDEFGGPKEYAKDLSPLLGQQAVDFNSISEGGFPQGRASVANILYSDKEQRNGKPYYVYEILTYATDGNEGGRHHLIASTVSNGYLYTFRFQVGDKRWFKGYESTAKKSWESFQVA